MMQDAPDKDCYTLPNGECVAPDCQLHGALTAEYVAKLEAVAHRAWHLMDDSGELPDAHDWQHSRRDHERLSGALDGLEAAGWDAHSDGAEEA